MKKIFLYTLLISFGISSCQTSKSTSSRRSNSSSENLNKEATVMWQQTAAEYDALCYQAFNMAKDRIDLATKENRGAGFNIVMDLDETVLDNSPYYGYLIKNNKDSDVDSWKRWVQLANAELVPGALDFIRYAESKGITIYYISNRSAVNINFTIENLGKRGVNATQENLLLSIGNTSKNGRRMAISKLGDLLLLIGDNLADFTGEYEVDMGFVERAKSVEANKDLFSRRFILVPNPMYGGWEKALNFDDPLIDENSKGGKLKHLSSFE